MALNTSTIISIVFLAAMPFLGGILMGVDRRLTARMQNRMGPPLIQPFYDVLKLWAKEPYIANNIQPLMAFMYLGFAMLAASFVAFQLDLLLMLFTTALADICLIVAAFSAKSPYSYIGGRREFLVMLSYEPVLLLVEIAISLVTGTFIIKGIRAYETPLLLLLPAAYVVMQVVLVVEMKKSPFDVSGSAHAHQELVRGVYTEFSGYTMALVEVGHWVKVVTMLAIVGLFWAPNPFIGTALALALFVGAILIDNVYPRLSWQRMLKTTWTIGFGLVIVNLLALSFGGVI
ncbi:MAG: NADH-quinone oxidoreductase subunit H [Candidatus Bathyarchaeota archaeon]|nr:NADH-quinone oxidoreductase subunit H [Candidatus Bathyarchaeota archaeon]